MINLTKEEIIENIKQLKFSCNGSGVGKLYQDIPFKEFQDFNKNYVWRNNNIERLKLFKKIDLKNKVILDIGCNIGYFCFKLAEKGAICHGVDFDEDNIKVANMLKDYKKINNVYFYHSKFDEEFIDKLLSKGLKFEIILLFSVIHWLMNYYHDINKIIYLLRKLHNSSQIIFYEPSSAGRAYYPQLLLNHNIKNFLRKIGYTNYKRLKSYYVSNIYNKRETWKGSVNLLDQVKRIYHKKNLNNIKKIRCFYSKNNLFFKITRITNNPRLFLVKNEIKIMNFLKNKEYVPYFYGYIEYKDYLFLIFEKLNLVALKQFINNPPLFSTSFKKKIPLLEKKLYELLDDLKKNQIIHRDLIPKNILVNRSITEVKVIDFEFACKNLKEIALFTEKDKNNFDVYFKKLCIPTYRIPSFKTLSYDIDNYAIKKGLFYLKRYNYSPFPLKLFRSIYISSYQFRKYYRKFLEFLINKPLDLIFLYNKRLKYRVRNSIIRRFLKFHD